MMAQMASILSGALTLEEIPKKTSLRVFITMRRCLLV